LADAAWKSVDVQAVKKEQSAYDVTVTRPGMTSIEFSEKWR